MTAGAAWDPPALPPRLVAAGQMPLVGRRAELETLERLWTDVEHGRRQVLFVGGEPGAGKTRLVAEAAGALADHDVAVLVGTSNLDTGIPYQPFIEMLDHLFASGPDGSLAALIGDDGVELRRLSRHVVRHRPELADAAEPPGEVRRDLFEAVAGLFRRMAEDRPVALVVDDLHWAQLPTLALLEHVVQSCPASRLLVVATFRTNAPDRSEEVATRLAQLHRLDGVRRLDLGGLDTEAIAEFLSVRTGLPLTDTRPPAALLRDRTGGNAFFLRELWTDLERRGGLDALRRPHRVPASIGDTVAARLAGLGDDVREFIELAAVVGDQFDLATLVAASDTDRTRTMAFVDAAMAVGLIETSEPLRGRYSFVHALTRQTVLDRMAPSRRTLLHARVAQALEAQPAEPSVVPRLAHHYLTASVLGFHDQALRYCRQAGELAEGSLAFEDAAVWFERAAGLPECDPAVRNEMLLAAGADYVRACHFPHAREIYERAASADGPQKLAAALGFEDASWRPGIIGHRAADVLSAAIDECGLDHTDTRYVRALGSLGRALALAGETSAAQQLGSRAIELARQLDDYGALVHVLTTSLWHGTTPEMAAVQLDRTTEVIRLAASRRDHENIGPSANFLGMVSYLCGRPALLEEALVAAQRSAEATGQPYYGHVYSCLAHADAFLRGDFDRAEHWSREIFRQNDTFGDDMAEGPHGVQMFMVERERGALERFRPYLDGNERFPGRWVPGLLALYTELGIETGVRRALRHLVDRDLADHTHEAQWPMELAFMLEAALSIDDVDTVRRLRPFLAEYAGRNLVCGTLIATFGSADRYLARVAALVGDTAGAERLFAQALEMDRHMRATVHVTETLAEHAHFAAAIGDDDRARAMAAEARALAEPIGQGRVLRRLEPLLHPTAGPDGLTDREVEVLRLLAEGLSNHEIGERLHISGNTAANHIRSILMKTGAANRTQAAMYAAQHALV